MPRSRAPGNSAGSPAEPARLPLGPPALPLTLLEWRALPEYLGGWLAMPLLQHAPTGDGHPVVVVPGLLSDYRATWLMRRFLRGRGYRVFDWRLGRNIGPVGKVEQALLAQIVALRRRTGQRPSIIGWSLGGVYARILAHDAPEHLRSVITLGSPLRHPHRSAVDAVYRRLSRHERDPAALHRIAAPPPVPATSIYSRLDGIVHWKACIADESRTSENIRVFGSHCGLPHQPHVLWIIADRLAQAEGAWQPFAARGR